MNSGPLIWMVLFAVSAGGFFLIASIVAIKGFSDLRHLLRTDGKKSDRLH